MYVCERSGGTLRCPGRGLSGGPFPPGRSPERETPRLYEMLLDTTSRAGGLTRGRCPLTCDVLHVEVQQEILPNPRDLLGAGVGRTSQQRVHRCGEPYRHPEALPTQFFKEKKEEHPKFTPPPHDGERSSRRLEPSPRRSSGGEWSVGTRGSSREPSESVPVVPVSTWHPRPPVPPGPTHFSPTGPQSRGVLGPRDVLHRVDPHFRPLVRPPKGAPTVSASTPPVGAPFPASWVRPGAKTYFTHSPHYIRSQGSRFPPSLCLPFGILCGTHR